jgi:uncharacterized membrane protein
MQRRTEHTQGGNAPLSQARRPDATALPEATLDTEADDTIIGRTVTINRPRGELFAFWRDFTNLPRFMDNIESIEKTMDPEITHWIVKAPAGRTVEWDSVITEERPDELLAWTSTPESSIRHSGSVQFRDAHGGRGTEVTVTIVYEPPAGTVGKAVAKLLGREPKVQARRDLRRFKQLMEAGEISIARAPDDDVVAPPTSLA